LVPPLAPPPPPLVELPPPVDGEEPEPWLLSSTVAALALASVFEASSVDLLFLSALFALKLAGPVGRLGGGGALP